MDQPSITHAARVAWGLDLAAPSLVFAQRGFSGLVCNDLHDLARWNRSSSVPVLSIADRLIATLIGLEHAAGARVSVGLAVPGWFGTLERHDLVERIVHEGPDVDVTCVGSPVCLAAGSNRAAVRVGSSPAAEVVLAVDAEIGWSAALVRMADDEIRELASVAVEPGAEVDRVHLLGALLADVGSDTAVDRIVVIGGAHEDEQLIEPLDELLGRFGPCPIGVVATRRTTAGGAMVLGDPEADLRSGCTLLPEWVPRGGAPWRLVLALPKLIGASVEPCESAAVAVAIASAGLAVSVSGLVGPETDAPLHAAYRGDEVPDASVLPDDADHRPARSAMPPPANLLADALRRCGRLLSSEVGVLVAVRSVPALLGCTDDAPDDELRTSARGIRALAERRDDRLGDALVEATNVGLRCIAEDAGHRYAFGTRADVAAEVERVVELLRVVVGVVAPAERRRLVRDTVLLGPEPALAAEIVDAVLASGMVPVHEDSSAAVATDPADVAVAIWSDVDHRFVLAAAAPDGALAIRVVVER